MTRFILKDSNGNESDPFESRAEAANQKDVLGLENAEIIEVDETATDGGQAAEQPAQPTDPEPVDETLPERDITDDPIQFVPSDFVYDVDGTPAINKKGFRVLQHWYDISTTSDVIIGPEETEFEYCRVKATAEMPDGRIAQAHGSAHIDRGDDLELLLEMADTRAKSRALSDITGVGAVALEELKSEL